MGAFVNNSNIMSACQNVFVATKNWPNGPMLIVLINAKEILSMNNISKDGKRVRKPEVWVLQPKVFQAT